MKKNEMLAVAGIFAAVIVVAILLFWPKPGNVNGPAKSAQPVPVEKKKISVPVIISLPELMSYKGDDLTHHIAKQFGPEVKVTVDDSRQGTPASLVKANDETFAMDIITYKESVLFVNFTLTKGVKEIDEIFGLLAIPVPGQEVIERSSEPNELTKYAGFDEIFIGRKSIPKGDSYKPVGTYEMLVITPSKQLMDDYNESCRKLFQKKQ